MRSADIIEVSEDTFETEVLQFSHHQPVIIDFWAPWCVPCRLQSPKLERLAIEAGGAFRLAKVNVDEEMNLAKRLKVTNLPAISAVVDGRIVAEYTGSLSDTSLRLFVDRVLPKASSLLLEKGKSLLLLGDYAGAEIALGQYLVESPHNSLGILAYSRALFFLGRSGEALKLLSHFPESYGYLEAQRLYALAEELNKKFVYEKTSGDPLAPIYAKVMDLGRQGKIEMALDGLLAVLRGDKHYRHDIAHKVYLAFLDVLSDDHPETRQYRVDLNSALF